MERETERTSPELARLYETQVNRWTTQVQTFRESVLLFQRAVECMAARRRAAPADTPRLTLSPLLQAASGQIEPPITGAHASPERLESIRIDGSPEAAMQAPIVPSPLPVSDGTAVSSYPCPLTLRQREIAALIARGYTNYQIARELVLTPGTVANHVRHILQKLGFQCRAQIAVWVIQNQLLPAPSVDDLSTSSASLS